MLVAGLAGAAAFSANWYLFQDDFVFIRQAQLSHLTVEYLRKPVFQHFSPWSRLGDDILAKWFHASYTAAHAIELGLFALTVLAFAWTADAFFAGRRWRHLLTLLFAQSLAILHITAWWTAAINILPATFFGLIALGSFARWRKTHDRRWLWPAYAAYLLSLGTHEQSWLVLGYLFLFDVLVWSPEGGLVKGLVRAWREWWVWAGFGLLTAAGIANYLSGYYGPLPRPGVPLFLSFLWVQFGQAFAATTTGLRLLTGGVPSQAAEVLSVAAVLAVVAVSLIRSPGAWRAWTVFGLGFLANALMVGLNRVGTFGPDFGLQVDYVQAPAYLFLLCAGCAFAMPPAPRPLRLPAAVGVTVLVLYEIAFGFSIAADRQRDSEALGAQQSATYFPALLAQLDRLGKRSTFALVDGPVPGEIVAPAFIPYNLLTYALPMLGRHVRFNRVAGTIYMVSADGALSAWSFIARSPLNAGLSTGGTCASLPAAGSYVLLRFAHPVSGWLALRLLAQSRGRLYLSAVSPAGGARLDDLSLDPLDTAPFLEQVPPGTDSIRLLAGDGRERWCFQGGEVGSLSPRS